MSYYHCPLGSMQIRGNDHSITSVIFTDAVQEPENTNDLLEKCKTELKQYFSGKLKTFSISVAPQGSDFQQQVWDIVQQISFGATISYGDIAKQLESETASRAVGAANGKNPIAIIIPCHRVVAANGDLTGYAWGMQRKQWLLEHEQKFSKGIQRLF